MSHPVTRPSIPDVPSLLGRLLVLLLPLILSARPALSDQTSDPNAPAFAGAVVVPLDDSFLDVAAIDGTTQFTMTAGGVPFTFSSTQPFTFIGVGQGGGPPLVLTNAGAIQVTPGAPVEALGFEILSNEGPSTGVFVGASGNETFVYPFLVPAFGGAFGIGDIGSATLTPLPLATWDAMRFVPSPSASCQADTDCPTGELCSLSTNTCVAGTSCTSDLDCSSGELCSATQQVCVAAGSSCSVSSDCAVGEYCSVTNDACVPGVACASAADCGAGEFCSATQQVCLPGTAPCVLTSDCPSGQLCSVADNVCVEGSPCSFNVDCGPGTVCSATNDVCVPGGSTCQLNGDCPSGELCSTADQVCVPGAACGSDADCGSGTFCSASSGVCVPGSDTCFVSSDCAAGELCSIADNRCVPGFGCGSDADCAAGTFCSSNGVCAPGTTACSGDGDCLSGELCSIADDVCVPGSACVDDSDCGNGTTCSASNGVCVSQGLPCSADNDCAAYLQVCADAGVCEDGAFATGLDTFQLQFLTPDGGPPTLDEEFGVQIEIPIEAGEVQYSGVSLTLSDPFQLELLPESYPLLGQIGVEIEGVPVQTVDVRVLDPDAGSVYLDLDGSLAFEVGEPVALVRSGSVLIDFNLPAGGDYDPERHFIPADGSVTVTLEPILSIAEPSHPSVRVVVTSVDPDTGGPNDAQGVFPRIALRDFEVDVDLAIDIRPLLRLNVVNPKSRGVIPVAILSGGGFRASEHFDPTTARFGPEGARAILKHGFERDVDRDGDYDLVLVFRTRETGIQCGETTAILTAETFEGEAFEGSDSIRTVGCKGHGKPKPHRYWWRDLLRRWPWWHPRGK